MTDCFGCDYYGHISEPATTTREVDGMTVQVCDECAKWYDQFETERKESERRQER